MNKPGDLASTARNVSPGNWAVEVRRPIATRVSSCVAVCLWDRQIRLGGVSCFVSPRFEQGVDDPAVDILRFGNCCLDALIGAMLAHGAQRQNLQASAFGGSRMAVQISGPSIGERNVAFAREWLVAEKIPLIAADFLGAWPRRIVFDPLTGDTYCKRDQASQNRRENEPVEAPACFISPGEKDLGRF